MAERGRGVFMVSCSDPPQNKEIIAELAVKES
jgi:hypothetical protein